MIDIRFHGLGDDGSQTCFIHHAERRVTWFTISDLAEPAEAMEMLKKWHAFQSRAERK